MRRRYFHPEQYCRNDKQWLGPGFCHFNPTVQLAAKKLTGLKIVFTNVGDPIIARSGKIFDDHLQSLRDFDDE
jgi:hypothetical protein